MLFIIVVFIFVSLVSSFQKYYTSNRISILNMAKRSSTSPTNSKKKSKSITNGIILDNGLEIIHPSFAPEGFNKTRARLIAPISSLTNSSSDFGNSNGQCVIYWMSRDQRLFDNYALLYAQGLAQNRSVPLKIVFNLYNTPNLAWGTMRAYGFMLRGLEEVEKDAREHNIPFHLLTGDVCENIPSFAQEHKAIAVVTDLMPLRHSIQSVNTIGETLRDTSIPVVQVDAHNIVPIWVASPKCEYGARTIRPKITKALPTWLRPFPTVIKQDKILLSKHSESNSIEGEDVTKDALPARINWNEIRSNLKVDHAVPEVSWLTPGYAAGMSRLDTFLSTRIRQFSEKRNDPNEDVASNLSPYFHFGQISVQRCISELKSRKIAGEGADSFIEEAVVRRELSDNFCFYNANYDSIEGAYPWAKETLALHSSDKREHTYTRDEFARAKTHDTLWNAAQIQLRLDGKMHGFLRMYWAKKILEWTESPEQALSVALYLNDRYSLDGRDPNGFVGCMWSIAGIHDQGWAERSVFGKIRYMNYAGCKRKFNVSSFEHRWKMRFNQAKMEAKAKAKAASSSSSSSDSK